MKKWKIMVMFRDWGRDWNGSKGSKALSQMKQTKWVIRTPLSS